MTKTEQMIWAAAFALQHNRIYRLAEQYKSDVDDYKDLEVNGSSCGEVADDAINKFREAINSYDAKDLIFIDHFKNEVAEDED